MKKYRIKYILLLFILYPEKGISTDLKSGDKAPPFYLIRLENQEYVKSEDYLGKKNLVICFFFQKIGKRPYIFRLKELSK